MHPCSVPGGRGVTEERGGPGGRAHERTALSSTCSGSYHPDVSYLVTTPPCGSYFWVCWQMFRATRVCLALEDRTNHSLLVSSLTRVHPLRGATVSNALHTLSFSFLFFPLSTLCLYPDPTLKLLSLQPGCLKLTFLI